MVSILVPFFFLFVVCYVNVEKHFCGCFHSKKLTLFNDTICGFPFLRKSDLKKSNIVFFFFLPLPSLPALPSPLPSLPHSLLPSFPFYCSLFFFYFSSASPYFSPPPSPHFSFLFIISQETPVKCIWVFQSLIS